MDGTQQVNIAEWLQIARFGIMVFAMGGAASGAIFFIKWFRNGKARQNALDMTPGKARLCDEYQKRIDSELTDVRNRLLIMETQSDTNHERRRR